MNYPMNEMFKNIKKKSDHMKLVFIFRNILMSKFSDKSLLLASTKTKLMLLQEITIIYNTPSISIRFASFDLAQSLRK